MLAQDVHAGYPHVHDIARVESRIAAVDAVADVVSALGALARAQLPRAESAAAEATAYADWIDETFARLVREPRRDAGADALIVLLGPERAFCGSLPQDLLGELPPLGRLGLVGRRAGEAARAHPRLEARIRFALSGPSSTFEIDEVAESVVVAMLAEAGGAPIDIIYPVASLARCHTVRFLPSARVLRRDAPDRYAPLPDLVRAALRETLAARLHIGLAEALRVELRARIGAAEAARRGADRKRDELREAWRVLRHQQITSELIELYAARATILDH